MKRLAIARIAPPTINGRAEPAPVFGIVVPRTLDVSLGAGAVEPPGDADAEALGDADEPPGNMPPLDEPDGDGDGEADALGEVCA